jgi:hypothetical protein
MLWCYGASISTGMSISTQGAFNRQPSGARQMHFLTGLATTIYQNSFRFCLDLELDLEHAHSTLVTTCGRVNQATTNKHHRLVQASSSAHAHTSHHLISQLSAAPAHHTRETREGATNKHQPAASHKQFSHRARGSIFYPSIDCTRPDKRVYTGRASRY